MAPLALAIPRAIQHQYLIVHLGSGSQSSRHITTLGFPVAFVDYQHTVATNFRPVSPTLCTDYNTHPSILCTLSSSLPDVPASTLVPLLAFSLTPAV